MIQPYLTFNGNCLEAMKFYRQCLGGELIIQTIGESPLSDGMPQKMKELVLHATLKKGSLVLMGSDIVPETGLIWGNAVSFVLNSKSRKQLKEWFTKLSYGGQKTYPIQATHWGSLFGGLIDQFGNSWLLLYTKNPKTKPD